MSGYYDDVDEMGDGEDDMDNELHGRWMDNLDSDEEYGRSECHPTEKGAMYYEFWQNTRSVKSTILHFQLRNLVWATSKHDVYLMAHYSVLHWSALH
ncbi:WD repeat-containing protein [Canna indica]|uniref:WD repeat-containing protein n=1 Tax=Canna indica TaxID=4628 RepID=A0AAQ3QFD6_9LILI|nr:WD repeat-containing protein [Canna indica]